MFEESTRLEIEKNKTIPVKKGKKYIYPFKEMEIGDSFFVPLNSKKNTLVTTLILSAARRDRMEGRKFTTRYIKEEDGIRCWRIE